LAEDADRIVENKNIVEVERLFIEIREAFNRYIITFQKSKLPNF
jgi:hypothetical protein